MRMVCIVNEVCIMPTNKVYISTCDKLSMTCSFSCEFSHDYIIYIVKNCRGRKIIIHSAKTDHKKCHFVNKKK